MNHPSGSTRRSFLKTSSTLAAGAALTGQTTFSRSAYAAGNETIKVALIGCGGRGNGAAYDCLEADPGTKIIAVADAFEPSARGAADRLRREKADRVDLPDERVFVGLDAYEKAIAAGPDLVILAAPPGFRPSHYAAAVKAGKHVFMEKPCCVDAPGYRTLVEANELADKNGLRVGVGLQRRHQQSYIEGMKKIHDGELGPITLLRVYWNGGGIWNRARRPEMTEMQYQVHNWYHFCWLCGDNICEQHVHNLDIANWAMTKDGNVKDAHPVDANGMGGCSVRYSGKAKGTGQLFDHHFVEFTYAGGTKMFSQCRHIPNTWSHVGEEIHCANGKSNGQVRAKGPNPYVQEHVALLKAVREGLPFNEGWYGATGSMTAVLGRMATYSGQIVRWDDAVAKGTSEFPATLAWDAPAPVNKDANGDYPIPVPGVYKPY